jgi:predicted kinase
MTSYNFKLLQARQVSDRQVCSSVIDYIVPSAWGQKILENCRENWKRVYGSLFSHQSNLIWKGSVPDD